MSVEHLRETNIGGHLQKNECWITVDGLFVVVEEAEKNSPKAKHWQWLGLGKKTRAGKNTEYKNRKQWRGIWLS